MARLTPNQLESADNRKNVKNLPQNLTVNVYFANGPEEVTSKRKQNLTSLRDFAVTYQQGSWT